jgi:very-short-patch-repair endonuclease
MAKATSISDCFFNHYGLPNPEREVRFDAKRKWRIDFAYPSIKLAIEIEGGAYTHGRHTRGSGFVKDMEKYNALTEAGWMLLRYTPSGINFEQIKRLYIAGQYKLAGEKF